MSDTYDPPAGPPVVPLTAPEGEDPLDGDTWTAADSGGQRSNR